MKKVGTKKGLRGMSLIEMAIALGIVGLVSAAIWAAGSTVRQRSDIEREVATVLSVVDRVRSLYTAFPGTANYPVSVEEQITANLFPEDVVLNATTTNNSWGGLVRVGFKRNNNWIVGFTVSMELPSTLGKDIRNLACTDLISRLHGAGRAGTGIQVVNDVPVPSVYPLPQTDQTPDGGPIYAYAGAGSWNNVTGKKPTEVLSTIGSDGCDRVAFYFKL